MHINVGEITVPGALPGGGDGLAILDAGGAAHVAASEVERLGGNAVPRYPTVLPYDRQAGYSREVAPRTVRTVTLSDHRTAATFLLDLGGRLWSLAVDGRELLHQPQPLMIGNLALRNAWFAGGTEWNLGFTGHWPLTCSPVFAGVVHDRRGEVLRLWEFERMLGLVWRIDLRIVDGVLLVHPVIENHTAATVPVYWWSNTAVPLERESRVLVPATDAWHYDERSLLELVPVPGTPDATRPGLLDGAADHFFRISGRPWIAAVGADGLGLGQVSTTRLHGRKLFRWGTGSGGRRWQRWLSPTGGDYLEIQAGLATTQLEHLPLPPGEVWEWTEAYGLVDAGVEAHGDWRGAVAAGSRSIEAMLGAERLDAADAWFAGLRDRPAEVLVTASGWGALQVAAGATLSPGTPFPRTSLGDAQRPWLEMVTGGALPTGDTLPEPVTGEPWRSLVSPADGWRERYLAALIALADGRRHEAQRLLGESVAERPSWQALRVLGHLSPQPARGDLLLRAWREHGGVPLLLEALDALHESRRGAEMITVVDTLDESTRMVPRVRLAEARAALLTGDLRRVGAVLDGGILEVPDLREGEDSLADLWAAYQAAAGTAEPLPAAYDFGMH